MQKNPGIPNIKLPAKATLWYLGVSIISKGIGILTTPIFTRILTTEGYGEFTLYMSLLGFGSVICSAISSGSSIYNGLAKSGGNSGRFLKTVLLLSIGFSVSICLLLFAFLPFFELDRIFYLPLSLQLLCDGVTAVALSSAKFRYEYKAVTVISLINAVLPPLISVILLKLTDFGYPVRIFSLLLVSLGVAIYSLIRIVKADRPDNRQLIDRSMIKMALVYTLPMLPQAISGAVTAQADKLIISSKMGPSALGKYSVIYSMGIALQFIVTAVGSALSPWIIRRLERGETKRISRLIFPMTVGYLALSLALISLAPEALMILAPDEYSDALPALLPIAASTPLYFIQTVVTAGIIHSGKAVYTLISSVIGGVLCITFNYTLVEGLGYLGAGTTMLITQATVTLISIILLSKTKAKDMIEPIKLCAIYLLFLPVAMLISKLKDSLATRLVLLVIPLFMLLYCLSRARSLVVEKGKKMGA